MADILKLRIEHRKDNTMEHYEMQKNEFSLDAFRENLKSMIEAKGIYAKDIAIECGMTPTSLSRYINGLRDPTIENLWHLATYFGTTIDFLIGANKDKLSDIGPDARHIVELYSMASVEDQAVIRTVLRKYEGRKQ